MKTIEGIHHVTAISGEPNQNLHFYTRVLGLRLVKVAVNYDDPSVHHLYFGDETGSPGTIMTTFPYANAVSGKRGSGQISAVAYAVPEGSLDFWVERFASEDVRFDMPVERFGERSLAFDDPDGLHQELIETPGMEAVSAWTKGGVAVEHAIRKFRGVSITVGDVGPTTALLSDYMGFQNIGQEGNRFRFLTPLGETIDLVHEPDLPAGRVAAGIVHHVAWRVQDDSAQLEWLEQLKRLGFNVSPVMDRQYFHSIYFREPGGALFEIATDGPGMLTDESVETLGSGLRLPEWMESMRERIESRLPALKY